MTTLHGRLDLPEHRPVFEKLSRMRRSSPSRTRSAGCCRLHRGRARCFTVCRRICCRPLDRAPSYLAFLGRISPEKGLPSAIRVAVTCGIPLKIAAKVDRVDVDYFNEEIKAAAGSTGHRVHRRDQRRGEVRVPQRRYRSA